MTTLESALVNEARAMTTFTCPVCGRTVGVVDPNAQGLCYHVGRAENKRPARMDPVSSDGRQTVTDDDRRRDMR